MKQDSFTRSDLAASISAKRGCTVESARQTIEDFLSAVTTALSSGKKVEFRGFGVIEVVKRKEKVGRNPKAPEKGTYRIPPRNVVRFRTGKELDETLNQEAESAA
jgi:integration host factor subunit beta